jgi:hypothetical protein
MHKANVTDSQEQFPESGGAEAYGQASVRKPALDLSFDNSVSRQRRPWFEETGSNALILSLKTKMA